MIEYSVDNNELQVYHIQKGIYKKTVQHMYYM